jgi:hypothetical protein
MSRLLRIRLGHSRTVTSDSWRGSPSTNSALPIAQSLSRVRRVPELSFSLIQANCRLVAARFRIRTYIWLDCLVVSPDACLRVHAPVLAVARGDHTRIVCSRRKLSGGRPKSTMLPSANSRQVSLSRTEHSGCAYDSEGLRETVLLFSSRIDVHPIHEAPSPELSLEVLVAPSESLGRARVEPE